MSDPLSVPAIASELQRVEGEIQGIPELQLSMDRQLLNAKLAYEKAKLKASDSLKSGGEKLLAAERELRIFELTEDEWFAVRDAEVQADYARTAGRMFVAQATALQSRLRAAKDVSSLHATVR